MQPLRGPKWNHRPQNNKVGFALWPPRTIGHFISISGLVVEYIVAIDVTRVRFPADACYVLVSAFFCRFSVAHVCHGRPRGMDTLGIEPRASRMLSGCDTTTPRALEKLDEGIWYPSRFKARSRQIANKPVKQHALDISSGGGLAGNVVDHSFLFSCPPLVVCVFFTQE